MALVTTDNCQYLSKSDKINSIKVCKHHDTRPEITWYGTGNTNKEDPSQKLRLAENKYPISTICSYQQTMLEFLDTQCKGTRLYARSNRAGEVKAQLSAITRGPHRSKFRGRGKSLV